ASFVFSTISEENCVVKRMMSSSNSRMPRATTTHSISQRSVYSTTLLVFGCVTKCEMNALRASTLSSLMTKNAWYVKNPSDDKSTTGDVCKITSLVSFSKR